MAPGPDGGHAAAVSSLVHYGVSQTLMGAFQALAEQTGPDGRRRHPDQALRRVRQAVLCRNYSGLCLELAWLLAAIFRAAPGQPDAVIRAFYVQNWTTRHRFVAALREGAVRLPGQWTDASANLAIDDARFVLHLDRLPTWVCLLELLVYIEPAIVSPAVLALPPTMLANRLQQHLYSYLAEHAQPVHQQRRLHALLRWLREQAPDAAPAVAITDARIFGFWCDPPAGLADVGRFRTVAEAFLTLREALAIGERISGSGREIAYEEWAEGLICQEEVEQLAGDDVVAVAALTGQPRFLTRRAAQELELLACHPEAIRCLPLTLVRMRVLGALQALAIDAVKRGRDPSRVSADIDYAGWLELLDGLRRMLGEMAGAAAGVLLAGEEWQEGLAVLVDWTPGLAGELARCGYLPEGPEVRRNSGLSALCLQSPAINQAVKTAQAALKATSRAGFKGDGDFAPAVLYREGATELRRLARRIDRLAATGLDWPGIFAADLSIARKRLLFLHTGADAAHD